MHAYRGRSWIVRIGLLLGGLAIGLLLVEGAFRVFHIGPTFAPVSWNNYRLSANPAQRYDLVPNSPDGQTVINRDGLRDRDYPRKKPAHTFRIACVGDSICYGFGRKPEETVPKQLEALLGRCAAGATRYEVLNLGVVGYNAVQVVERVRTKALAYEPDAIVYMYCLNDPQEYSFEMDNLLDRLPRAYRNYVSPESRWRAWLAQSHFLHYLVYLLQCRRGEGPAPAPNNWWFDDPQAVAMQANMHVRYFTQLHKDPVHWKPAAGALNKLAGISKANNIPVLLLIVPLFMDEKGADRLAATTNLLGEVHAFVTQEARKRGFRVLDLYPPYQAYTAAGLKPLNYDSLHLTRDGSSYTALITLANLLHEKLLPEGVDLSRVPPSETLKERQLALVGSLFPDEPRGQYVQ